MFSFITMCLAAFLLFNECNGRFHRRNKLVRRQNAPMPPPNNMVQGPYPAQPPQTPVPSAYEMPPNPAMAQAYPPLPNAGNFLPPLPAPYAANPPVSSGSASLPGAPGQGSYPGNNPNFVPNGLTNQSQTLATYNPLTQNLNPNPVPLNKRAYQFRKNVPVNSYGMKKQESPRMLHSHSNPFRESIQRRRKSVLVKKINLEHVNKSQRNLKPASEKRKTKETAEKKGEMQKLLEEGEKILEISTESKSMKEETSSKSLNDFFEEDDEINGNVTVIPIPKGIQLKTNSAKGNKHVEETVNITSSTQKTLSVGNNTEIENVMEMEMEKKIEDDKGDSKGSEQVKIVETERVKPVILRKSNSHKHRKRRFPLRKLFKQHRGKRSTTHSASFYNQIMKKFLHDLKRSDRAIRMTGELNRIETTTPRQSDGITRVAKKTYRSREGKKLSVQDKSEYDSGEMEEFLKQVLTELRKLRKTREKNVTRHRKKHNYPKHKKSVMNLNVTRDDKLQYYKPERSEYIPVKSELTNTVSSTTQRAFTILYLSDKKGTDYGLVFLIILCIMTFLLPLLLCIFPQLYKTYKFKEGCSAMKQYPFCYPELENNKGKEGICKFHRETFAADEHLQLEWQSDNGDWLSEKEIEFK